MIKFDCPACGQHFSVNESAAGKKSKCPKCQGAVTVPKLPAPEPVYELPEARLIPREQPRPSAVQPAEQLRYVPVPFQVPAEEPQARDVRHTHRAKGSFGTGFGGMFGCLTAVAVFGLIGLFFLVGGCGLFAKKVIDKVEQAREEQKEQEKKTDEVKKPEPLKKTEQDVKVEPKTQEKKLIQI